MIRIVTRKDLREQIGIPAVGPGAISEKLREILLSNPAATRDDNEPIQILSIKDGEAIGRLNLFSGKICVEGADPQQIQWGSGFLVPPEHRASGAGLAILFRAQGLPYAMGSVGASQLAAPIYRKLNWVDLIAPRYLLPRRARPLLERYIKQHLLLAIAAALGTLALKLYGLWPWLRILSGTAGLRVEAINRLPDELDPLVQRISKPAYCWRSVAWVNWIANTPGRESPGLFLVRDSGGRPVGYFLIRHQLHTEGGGGKWKNFVLGSVKDWMTFDSSAVTDAQLIGLGIRELMRHPEIDVIDACVAEEHDGQILRGLGMRRMGGMHFMFRARPKSPLDHEQYRDIAAWRIRPADGDYFLF